MNEQVLVFNAELVIAPVERGWEDNGSHLSIRDSQNPGSLVFPLL